VREACEFLMRARGTLENHCGITWRERQAHHLVAVDPAALLATLSFWLDRKVQPQARLPDAAHGTIRFLHREFFGGQDESGRNAPLCPCRKASGALSDDNSTQLELPRLVYFDYERAPVTVRSETAEVVQGGDDVFFRDDVQIIRSAYATNAELGVFTSSCMSFRTRDLAMTDKPVRIVEGTSTASSVGLEFNNVTREIKLLSDVKASYETPRHPAQNRKFPRAARCFAWPRLCFGRCAGHTRADLGGTRGSGQAVNLEADRVDLDDAKKEAYSSKCHAHPRHHDHQGGQDHRETGRRRFSVRHRYGKPAHFRQKREGFDEYIEGFPSAWSTMAKPTRCRCSQTPASSARVTRCAATTFL
jgi:hypothetical protein